MSPLNFAGSFLFGIVLPMFVPAFFENDDTGAIAGIACCFLAALVFINRKD